jgi:hypothetical protein
MPAIIKRYKRFAPNPRQISALHAYVGGLFQLNSVLATGQLVRSLHIYMYERVACGDRAYMS